MYFFPLKVVYGNPDPKVGKIILFSRVCEHGRASHSIYR